jgi:hypothetical protein
MRTLPACASLALLAACGGGGGASSPVGPPPPAPPAPAPVNVRLDSPLPASIAADINAGESTPAVTLSARLAGDLGALAGRNLFVVVEDPQQLYAATAVLTVDLAAQSGRIALPGRAQPTAGNRSGNLRVQVCLDAACASPLAGSPLVFPYRVTVHPGLVIPATVDIALDFGAEPQPQDIAITLPFGVEAGPNGLTMIEQGSDNRFADATRQPFFSTLVPTTADRAASKLVARPRLAPPGNFSTPYNIRSDWTSSAGAATRLHTLRVNYTVRPSSVPVAFAPAALTVSIPAGREQSEFTGVFAVAQQGSVGLSGVTLLDPPPAAADPNAPYASWLGSAGTVASNPGFVTSFTMSVCARVGGLNGTLHCMVPGTYRAQARFALTHGGGTQEFTVPISLTVTP